MSKVIIYKQDIGTVAIIRPSNEALNMYGIQAIAMKDVPTGKRFRIIDSSEIPADRSQRAAWTVDDSDLTDGIGAERNEFEGSA